MANSKENHVHAYHALTLEAAALKDSYTQHFHSLNEIVLCTDGGAIFNIQGREYQLAAHDLIILGYLDSHSVEINRFPYDRIVLTMTTYILEQHLKNPYLISLIQNHRLDFPYVFHLDEETYNTILLLAKEAIHEYEKKEQFWEQQYAYAISSIIITVYRKNTDLLGPQIMTSSQARVLQLQSYLLQHFREDISMDDLADQFFYSSTYLGAQFKHYIGMSINEYIIKNRLNEAKEKLVHTNLSVQEIGSLVGYPNANHFSRIFRKYENMSPSEFRTQFKDSVLLPR